MRPDSTPLPVVIGISSSISGPGLLVKGCIGERTYQEDRRDDQTLPSADDTGHPRYKLHLFMRGQPFRWPPGR